MSPGLNLIIQNNDINVGNEDIIDEESKTYNDLLTIYDIARMQTETTLKLIQSRLNQIYGYKIIENVSSRLKSKRSIKNKMKKKDYDYTYIRLVDNINDIAGIRVVCPLEDDIYIVKQIIENMPKLKVIEEKDYLKHPKKSGYRAYHLICETPVVIKNETVVIKVEIQIRTVAMDFWSEMEHDIRYKSNGKISLFDSKKLTWYAKALELMQRKVVKLYRRNENKTIDYSL